MIYLLISIGVGLFWYLVLEAASAPWAAVVGFTAFVTSFLAMSICAASHDEDTP